MTRQAAMGRDQLIDVVCKSCKCLGMTAGIVALYSSYAPAEPQRESPIPHVAPCPLETSQRHRRITVPEKQLNAFYECVSRYGNGHEWEEASRWLTDWYRAASCLAYCDDTGIRKVAHVSMWRGSRYVIASSAEESRLSASCRTIRIAVAAAFDEAVNALGYHRVLLASVPAYCKTREAEMALRKSEELADEARDLTAKLRAFEALKSR